MLQRRNATKQSPTMIYRRGRFSQNPTRAVVDSPTSLSELSTYTVAPLVAPTKAAGILVCSCFSNSPSPLSSSFVPSLLMSLMLVTSALSDFGFKLLHHTDRRCVQLLWKVTASLNAPVWTYARAQSCGDPRLLLLQKFDDKTRSKSPLLAFMVAAEDVLDDDRTLTLDKLQQLLSLNSSGPKPKGGADLWSSMHTCALSLLHLVASAGALHCTWFLNILKRHSTSLDVHITSWPLWTYSLISGGSCLYNILNTTHLIRYSCYFIAPWKYSLSQVVHISVRE